MKSAKLIILTTLFILLAPYFSLAQIQPPEDLPEPGIPTSLFSCLPTDTLRRCMLRLLGDALRVILVIALAASALMIAWAGIIYVTKGSDENSRKAAQKRVIYAVVGLVVAFLSWVLTAMISRIVGRGGTSI